MHISSTTYRDPLAETLKAGTETWKEKWYRVGKGTLEMLPMPAILSTAVAVSAQKSLLIAAKALGLATLATASVMATYPVSALLEAEVKVVQIVGCLACPSMLLIEAVSGMFGKGYLEQSLAGVLGGVIGGGLSGFSLATFKRGIRNFANQPKRDERRRAFSSAIVANHLSLHNEDRQALRGLPNNGKDRCTKIMLEEIVKSHLTPSVKNLPAELHEFAFTLSHLKTMYEQIPDRAKENLSLFSSEPPENSEANGYWTRARSDALGMVDSQKIQKLWADFAHAAQ